MTDWQLLEEFRRDGSQQAFAELVGRHLSLVYGVCRRRLRDAHLAEDAAQAVFVVLARRGPKCAIGSSIAPWLHKTAGYACANAARAAKIRQHHEQLAAEQATRMHETRDQNLRDDSDLLDQAMKSALSESDRQVVLLRFYEDRDLSDIGAALGIASNTAAKRLSRAIERLRRFLALRGHTISTAALGEAIVRLSHAPVPSGLGAKIVATAAGQLALPVVSQQLVHGVMQMIRYTQLKFAAMVTGLALAGGGGAVALATFVARPAAEVGSPATQPAAAAAPGAAVTKAKPTVASYLAGATTPKGLLKQFARAVRAGDADALRALVSGHEENTKVILDTTCQYITNTDALKAAINDRFGAGSFEKLSAGHEMTPVDSLASSIEKEVDKLPLTIEGNNATLITGDGPDDMMPLVKEDKVWRIAADKYLATWKPEQYTQRLNQIQMASDAVAELTKAVAAGRFASVEEVGEYMQEMARRARQR